MWILIVAVTKSIHVMVWLPRYYCCRNDLVTALESLASSILKTTAIEFYRKGKR
jgi:hypothetical protein